LLSLSCSIVGWVAVFLATQHFRHNRVGLPSSTQPTDEMKPPSGNWGRFFYGQPRRLGHGAP
jgi:hypothetical protein